MAAQWFVHGDGRTHTLHGFAHATRFRTRCRNHRKILDVTHDSCFTIIEAKAADITCHYRRRCHPLIDYHQLGRMVRHQTCMPLVSLLTNVPQNIPKRRFIDLLSILCLPNEDFGRQNKRSVVSFRRTFEGCEYSVSATMP